jgi:hypothetical protein
MVVLYTPPAPETVTKSGVSFGLRVGVAFPGGMVSQPDPVVLSTGDASDAFGVMIPVTLDLGYRLTPHWYLGAYLSIGYVTGTNCDSIDTAVTSCSYTDYRFGFDVQYNILPDRMFQPWIGLGAGWEVANQFQSDDVDGESQSSASGIEFGHVDVGLDWRFLDHDKLGVYFLTSFADYDDGYVHEWYMVGLRWRHDTNWLHMAEPAAAFPAR